jgi:hypothetical protein
MGSSQSILLGLIKSVDAQSFQMRAAGTWVQEVRQNHASHVPCDGASKFFETRVNS